MFWVHSVLWLTALQLISFSYLVILTVVLASHYLIINQLLIKHELNDLDFSAKLASKSIGIQLYFQQNKKKILTSKLKLLLSRMHNSRKIKRQKRTQEKHRTKYNTTNSNDKTIQN